MDFTQALLTVVGAVAGLVVLRLIYVWNTRIRPLQPSLDLVWAADCEHLTTANVDGSSITFQMVRNFTWRTTRDRDEDWIEEVHVDAEDLKDVWFIVDHFHSIKGMAHTYLTFEFGSGTCLSFSFESRREKGERYHPWDGLWRAYELYLLVGLERDVTGLRTHGRRNRDYMLSLIHI